MGNPQIFDITASTSRDPNPRATSRQLHLRKKRARVTCPNMSRQVRNYRPGCSRSEQFLTFNGARFGLLSSGHRRSRTTFSLNSGNCFCSVFSDNQAGGLAFLLLRLLLLLLRLLQCGTVSLRAADGSRGRRE